MPTYKAPIRDMMFVLDEVIGTDRVLSMPKFSEVGKDLIEAVFSEAKMLIVPLSRADGQP